MKAEISNLDPETNPKLKESFDLLLLAGYFRIRIPSINPFDKILGGLSWCITQSNFAIDIQYSDDYNIGQKIKVCEKIVKALNEMNSPFKLQPHQIQGLDLGQIYPVIKWLIKFVLETREFRQDQNSRVSKLVGKNSLQALQTQDEDEKKAINEVISQLDLLQDTRQTKNTKKLSKRDPLRVYSTLIEYGDLSSQRTYNKFCAIISGVQNNQKGGKQNINTALLGDDGHAPKKQDNQQSMTLEQLTNMAKEKQQQTQASIKEMSAKGGPAEDATLNEEEGKKFRKLGRRNSIAGAQIVDLISRDKIADSLKQQNEEDEEMTAVGLKLQEKQLQEQQLKVNQQTLLNLERKIQQHTEECQSQLEQQQQLEQQYNEEHQRKKDLEEALKIIESKTKKANQAEVKRAEELINKKTELRDEKAQLRKEIKGEMQQLQVEHEKATEYASVDESELVAQLRQEYNQKKDKYEKKFLQFQQLNQEIAVLQRQIENYPSPSEIAQYHQRFVELYDSINNEMVENKKLILRYNNFQDVSNMTAQYVEIMRTFKENYSNNLKDKKGKQELSKNLDATYAVLYHKYVVITIRIKQYHIDIDKSGEEERVVG